MEFLKITLFLTTYPTIITWIRKLKLGNIPNVWNEAKKLGSIYGDIF